MDREDERERADQVRSDAHQHAPFAGCLEHQAQVTSLEVPQAAVDQAARAGAGAEPQVGLLHEHRGEPAHRGVPGDGRADDAAPDDQQIDRLGAQGVEGRPA
jgi:hypothetical protein